MYDFTLVYTGFSYKVESTGFMQLAFLIFYCQTSNYYKLISNNPLTAFPPLLSISEVTNIPDGQKDTHCKKKKIPGHHPIQTMNSSKFNSVYFTQQRRQ